MMHLGYVQEIVSVDRKEKGRDYRCSCVLVLGFLCGQHQAIYKLYDIYKIFTTNLPLYSKETSQGGIRVIDRMMCQSEV